MNSRKKCPEVPRRTSRPGAGMIMPRRGNPGMRRQQTSSIILYETGEVYMHAAILHVLLYAMLYAMLHVMLHVCGM